VILARAAAASGEVSCFLNKPLSDVHHPGLPGWEQGLTHYLMELGPVNGCQRNRLIRQAVARPVQQQMAGGHKHWLFDYHQLTPTSTAEPTVCNAIIIWVMGSLAFPSKQQQLVQWQTSWN